MIVDRLKEFCYSSGHVPKSKQPLSPPSLDKTFFSTVADVNRLIRHAEGCTKKSEILHKQAAVAVSRVETINEEIEIEKEEFKRTAAEAKGMIEALNHPNERLLKPQKLALNRKLLKVIEAFEQMQRTSRVRYRTCLERQYLILNPTADASELATISQISLEVAPQTLFAVTNASGKLAEMKARQIELKRLEKDVLELHELTLRLQQVVKEQGEKVQSLDDYVSGIEEQTSKTAEVMVKSVEGKRVLQRRKWILILTVIVILIVTGVIIYIAWRADQKTIIVQAPQPQPQPLPQPVPQPTSKKSREMMTQEGPNPNDIENQEEKVEEPQESPWSVPEPMKPEDTGEASPTEIDLDELNEGQEGVEST